MRIDYSDAENTGSPVRPKFTLGKDSRGEEFAQAKLEDVNKDDYLILDDFIDRLNQLSNSSVDSISTIKLVVKLSPKRPFGGDDDTLQDIIYSTDVPNHQPLFENEDPLFQLTITKVKDSRREREVMKLDFHVFNPSTQDLDLFIDKFLKPCCLSIVNSGIPCLINYSAIGSSAVDSRLYTRPEQINRDTKDITKYIIDTFINLHASGKNKNLFSLRHRAWIYNFNTGRIITAPTHASIITSPQYESRLGIRHALARIESRCEGNSLRLQFDIQTFDGETSEDIEMYIHNFITNVNSNLKGVEKLTIEYFQRRDISNPSSSYEKVIKEVNLLEF